MYWSGNCITPTTMKAAIHLVKITMRIRSRTGTPTSKSSRRGSDITQKLILKQNFEILNVSTIEWTFFPWMRSTLVHDKEIKRGEKKTTRLPSFSSVSGKDERTSRSKCEVERSTSRLPEVQRLQKIIWNQWRANWVRMNFLQKIHIVADSPKIQEKSGRSSNESRRIRRSDHLDVSVQRYLLDKENSNECLSNSEKVKPYAKKCFPRGRWSFLGPRKNDTERTSANLEDNTILLQMSWWKFSKKVDIRHFEVSVRWIEDGWKQYRKYAIHFSAESSHAELLISHDSHSKPTQYYRSCSELVWRIDSAGTWSIALEHGEISRNRKKWSLSYRPPRRQRETACIFMLKDLKNCQARSNSRKLLNQRDSWRECPLECTSKIFHDVDDGFESKIRACREYTKPREDPSSEVIAWISHTKIGPILHVKTNSDIVNIRRRIKMLGC